LRYINSTSERLIATGKIDTDSYNIWRYNEFYSYPIGEDNRLTLQEGWTKEVESHRITSSLNLERLFLKREDLNPTGSHKARSLAYQVSKALEDGEEALVISSSGNAAVSAAAYCRLAGIKLFAFVSPRTNLVKLAQLHRFSAEIIVTERAINFAKYFADKYRLINLRPSTNELAPEGFKSIAFEIFEKIGEIEAIFMFTSSASSLVGIGRAYLTLRDELKLIDKLPELHSVQAGMITSIASKFDKLEESDKGPGRSIIGDLGVKKTRRAKEAIELIKASCGSGWIVSDEMILEASALLSENGIDTSWEGAAALAGVRRACETRSFKRVVCLLTGHPSQRSIDSDIQEMKTNKITSREELDKLAEEILVFKG